MPIYLGGFVQLSKWTPNRLEQTERRSLLSELDTALRSIVNNRDVFLLSIVHALYEASFFLAVFLWTPLLLHRGDTTRITYVACGKYLNKSISKPLQIRRCLCGAHEQHATWHAYLPHLLITTQNRCASGFSITCVLCSQCSRACALRLSHAQC